MALVYNIYFHMKTIKRFLASTLFFLFILLLIILADLDQKNLIIDLGRSVPFGDKIGHFILFGTLALLLNVALRFKRIHLKLRTFHLGSVIVFAFASVEEFTQLAFSTRTFDLVDMLFDLLGIGLLSSVAFRRFIIKTLQRFTQYLIEHLHVKT